MMESKRKTMITMAERIKKIKAYEELKRMVDAFERLGRELEGEMERNKKIVLMSKVANKNSNNKKADDHMKSKDQSSSSIFVDLKVNNQDGNEVFFRIKRNIPMRTLMNKYCDKQSVDITDITFLFDGCRIQGEQTADELKLEDGDEIDVMTECDGGSML